jgi:chromate transporter
MSTSPSGGQLPDGMARPSAREIIKEWGRIGCLGFGGPPAHIALLRELCVTRRGWLSEEQFERSLAAANMLPGPASTQLAIYCAWRVRGARGALLGGACFILPGLVLILALSVLFLAGSPPRWVRGASLGAGAAVAAIAVRAGLDVALPLWRRAHHRQLPRIALYSLAGAAAAAALGPWLVLVLLAAGVAEVAASTPRHVRSGLHGWPLLAGVSLRGGNLALAWSALKVGALSFGGGFVIVPLMQSDAVSTYHWMTHAQFLSAVALGQITPGPVVLTVAAVGYAAGGLPAGVLAAAVAFAPSFAFVLLGAGRFERLVRDERALAFLRGAASCAAGAIIGSAVPLASALSVDWQYALLAGAAVLLLVLRRRVFTTLLLAGAIGVLAALLGAPL